MLQVSRFREALLLANDTPRAGSRQLDLQQMEQLAERLTIAYERSNDDPLGAMKDPRTDLVDTSVLRRAIAISASQPYNAGHGRHPAKWCGVPPAAVQEAAGDSALHAEGSQPSGSMHAQLAVERHLAGLKAPAGLPPHLAA